MPKAADYLKARLEEAGTQHCESYPTAGNLSCAAIRCSIRAPLCAGLETVTPFDEKPTTACLAVWRLACR